MKIIKLSQRNDRENWLDLRRGKIGGSTVKGIKPLTRGADRTPIGFWELLAEKIAIAKDGESERERGLRCEPDALRITADKIGKELDLDAGMWVSDVDEDISVSPDSAEPSDKPTYAAEAKCFDTKNHIKIIAMDKQAKANDDYNGFDSIPKEYQDQVLQYFVVNEDLQTLYWTLYDDRIVLDNLMHYIIKVERNDIKDEIEQLLQIEIDTLNDIRQITKELKEYK